MLGERHFLSEERHFPQRQKRDWRIGAVIVTEPEPTRHAGRDGAEAPMHPLADRLERLEAIG
jgi:hypothetical protein